ncbi:MAG: EAL domain-containing protein [Firmicutes bacterium]|nr:EAL domain-containing protein [Bacillota bacterium]
MDGPGHWQTHWLPINDIRSGEPFALEALLRIPDPADSLCSDWLNHHDVEIAATHLRAAANLPDERLVMFIHIEPHTLVLQHQSLQQMLAIAGRTLDLRRVTLEITERDRPVLLSEGPWRALLTHLREQGVQFALDNWSGRADDFELALRFAPTFVKLRCPFAGELDSRSRLRNLRATRALQSMLHRCHRTGTRAIVSCIETPGQLQAVMQRGVCLGQGRAIGPALPVCSPTAGQPIDAIHA